MSDNTELLKHANDNPGKVRKRQRSTIGFPYTDYDSSFEIATAIHSNAGLGQCPPKLIAQWTKQSTKSSGFRTQLAAAKLFGIIEDGDETGELQLTELGRQIVDPNKARTAKAETFLCVPLFKALYEKYKDDVMPPRSALEWEIVSLGVAEKQKAKARQVFESSAKQTGFRDADNNRLVMPDSTVKTEKKSEKKDSLATKDDYSLDLDPLIVALLRKIPKEEWAAGNRLRWFRTFAMNVSQVYDDDSNIVELKIELVSQEAEEKKNAPDGTT